jgi:hypothetical protein
MKNTFKALLLVTITVVAFSCNQSSTETANEGDAEIKSGNAVPLSAATLQGDELISTNFGDIQLKQSYLTKESIDKLNDQLSLQRAIEVYQWSLPVATFQKWYNEQQDV